jgi:hypothetical protein
MIGQRTQIMLMTRTIRTLLLAIAFVTLSQAASAQIRISVAFGPPALPIYEQPLCPGDGYMWTPGYWAWDGAEYYWVPGTWILAPEVGFLWTPPWWGWEGGAFLFHEGFWGASIGFYGGINYGFGYFGVGFLGGRWEGGHFFYNRSITNINVTNIRNVYNENVNVTNVSHVSFNGGQGGIEARPTAEEEAAAQGRHLGPVAAQTQHLEAARGNPQLRASVNHGAPPIAATARPGEFRGSAVVAAREAGGEYRAPENRGVPAEAGARGGAPIHPSELPPIEHPPAPNTGNAKRDALYQRQQQKLVDKQNQERQKLQQQQDKEHAQLARQHASQTRQQQVERRHQQQTQRMVQRHQNQTQRLQSRQGGGRPK